jgi:hypothetical protein
MEINYKGRTIPINENLLEKQNAWKNLHEIIETRIKLLDLLDLAQTLKDQNQLTEENCADILAEVREQDYNLQDYWNFERDSNYHTYEWRLPGCTCPCMDNLERVGLRIGFYHNDSCPYHGGNNENS